MSVLFIAQKMCWWIGFWTVLIWELGKCLGKIFRMKVEWIIRVRVDHELMGFGSTCSMKVRVCLSQDIQGCLLKELETRSFSTVKSAV